MSFPNAPSGSWAYHSAYHSAELTSATAPDTKVYVAASDSILRQATPRRQSSNVASPPNRPSSSGPSSSRHVSIHSPPQCELNGGGAESRRAAPRDDSIPQTQHAYASGGGGGMDASGGGGGMGGYAQGYAQASPPLAEQHHAQFLDPMRGGYYSHALVEQPRMQSWAPIPSIMFPAYAQGTGTPYRPGAGGAPPPPPPQQQGGAQFHAPQGIQLPPPHREQYDGGGGGGHAHAHGGAPLGFTEFLQSDDGGGGGRVKIE